MILGFDLKYKLRNNKKEIVVSYLPTMDADKERANCV
jgi:hypothetical protein